MSGLYKKSITTLKAYCLSLRVFKYTNFFFFFFLLTIAIFVYIIVI